MEQLANAQIHLSPWSAMPALVQLRPHSIKTIVSHAQLSSVLCVKLIMFARHASHLSFLLPTGPLASAQPPSFKAEALAFALKVKF